MKTDTLDRRLRWAKPNPRVTRLVITPADIELFAFIDRHGYATTRYLHAATIGQRKNYAHLQHRLTELFNGDIGGSYLSRPSGQHNAFEARYQDLVYALTDRARQLLGARLSRFDLKRSEFVHDLMGASVGATFELEARGHGLLYMSRDEVLGHEKSPSRDDPDALALPVDDHHRLIPDDLFALEYTAGKRFFAVEIDRQNESITGKARNTFERKIAGYIAAMQQGLTKARWGIAKLNVMTVTTNLEHARRLNRQAKAMTEGTPFADRFWFAAEPCFGARSGGDDAYWRVPKGLLTHLLTEPWLTPLGPRDIRQAK